MDRVRFAVIGSGWRSEFYLRAAAAMAERFEMVGLLCRSEEKARLLRQRYDARCVLSRGELLAGEPHFVVVAVNKDAIFTVSREYLELGLPVLAETPAAATVEELEALWLGARSGGWKVQVAEQYQFYPSYAATIAEARSGRLGELQNVLISCVHGYHGMSLSRLLLGLENEACAVSARSYPFTIIETDSRAGLIVDGRVSKRELERVSLEFQGGKNIFYSFSSVQYHSLIRSRHLLVQGSRGEIDDHRVRYVDERYEGQEREIHYSTPIGLTEDEFAVGRCLQGMASYLQTGEEFYPLASAIQDAYLSLLMDQAIQTGSVVQSEAKPWQRL